MSGMIVIFVDSLYGDDSYKGDIEAPLKTLQHAINTAAPGAIIILQRGTGVSYGDVSLSKNVTIQSAYGNKIEVGTLSVGKNQCLFDGLYFKNLAKGIDVIGEEYLDSSIRRTRKGSVLVRECEFEDVETPINLENVNYISIHRNRFKGHKWGVRVNKAREVNISSNVFDSGFRSIQVVSSQRLDIWRNTIYGASEIASGINPDENLRVIYVTLAEEDIENKELQLPGFAFANTYGYDVAVNVVNGPSFKYGQDYTVIGFGSILNWAGLQLEQEFKAGDLIRIMYSEDVDPGGGNAITAMGITDPNSRVDSNNISGKATDISLGVFFDTPMKFRYNNLHKVTTWFDGVTPSAVGNFSSDPLYVDPGNGDFRLQPTSPDIDRGDPQRWDQIFNEMGIANTGFGYTGLPSFTRTNIAPFGRDIDIVDVHRRILGPTGDIGAHEYDIYEGSNGSYVKESGYDQGTPGTDSKPYGTVDRGFNSATGDFFVGANDVPYQIGAVYYPTSDGMLSHRYGRYISKDTELSPRSMFIGEDTDRDLAYVYPSYPSYSTGAVYVSEDGDDASAGTKAQPFRTIDRALQEVASAVIVEPGLYAKFTGVSSKKLIGLRRQRIVPIGKKVYTNFLDGSWVTFGDVYLTNFSALLTDSTVVDSVFTFSEDMDFKVTETVKGDTLLIRLYNTTNKLEVLLDRFSSEMTISYMTDGFTYEYYYTFTGDMDDVMSSVGVYITMLSGGKVTFKIKNDYIDKSLTVTLGSGISDPWKIYMLSTGMGVNTVAGIYVSSTVLTGATGSTEMYTSKKVYGIRC